MAKPASSQAAREGSQGNVTAPSLTDEYVSDVEPDSESEEDVRRPHASARAQPGDRASEDAGATPAHAGLATAAPAPAQPPAPARNASHQQSVATPHSHTSAHSRNASLNASTPLLPTASSLSTYAVSQATSFLSADSRASAAAQGAVSAASATLESDSEALATLTRKDGPSLDLTALASQRSVGLHAHTQGFHTHKPSAGATLPLMPAHSLAPALVREPSRADAAAAMQVNSSAQRSQHSPAKTQGFHARNASAASTVPLAPTASLAPAPSRAEIAGSGGTHASTSRSNAQFTAHPSAALALEQAQTEEDKVETFPPASTSMQGTKYAEQMLQDALQITSTLAQSRAATLRSIRTQPRGGSERSPEWGQKADGVEADKSDADMLITSSPQSARAARTPTKCTKVQPFHLSSSNATLTRPRSAGPDWTSPSHGTTPRSPAAVNTLDATSTGTATLRGRSRTPRSHSRSDLASTLQRAAARRALSSDLTTRVQPFRLISPALHEHAQQQLELERLTELAKAARRREFHARPISPRARRGSAPHSISPKHKAPTKAAPFHLLSIDRHERYLNEVLPMQAQKEAAAAAACAAADAARQAKEAEEIKALRKSLDAYTKARPMPDASRPFTVDYDLVKPPTRPEPFKLSTEYRYHVHAVPPQFAPLEQA